MTASSGREAKNPASNRMVVPLFPHSKSLLGVCQSVGGCTTTLPFSSVKTAPTLDKQARVDSQSSPLNGIRTMEGVLAAAANM
jgi:hypothetical protein